MTISGKTALVTGASKGIGEATAVSLAKAGCSVCIDYKTDIAAAQKVLAECNKFSSGNFIIKADVSIEGEVSEMIKTLKERFSSLDILVNNAGIFDDEDDPTNIEVFERVYKNNFLSCILVTKHVLSLMKAGRIVNVSSVHGKLGGGRPTAAAYSSFKAALENWTKNLARELAPAILVNAIAPGPVLTPMWGDLDRPGEEELGKEMLIKRMLKPQDIAEGILFLISSDSMCGEILTMSGGK